MKDTDPYQWFFPLGILFGILGTGLWISFDQKWLAFYPGAFHSEIMTTGFVLTVAAGFLMTAIPRFTGTKSANFWEKLLPAIVILGLFFSALQIDRHMFYTLASLLNIFLIRFMVSRIRVRAFTPPPSFALVAFGLLACLIGNLAFLFNEFLSVSAFSLALSRLLLNYGLAMGLILGVGTQLIPALLGLKRTVLSDIQTNSRVNRFDKKGTLFFGAIALILFLSFVLQAADFLLIGRLINATLVSVLILTQWRIYLPPQNPGIFGWCLWISAWMFILGVWPGVLFPQFAIHGAHIFFIGSVSLMIFTVATRVTLSHGNHDMLLEKKSIILNLMLAFILLAMATRLVAPFVNNYFSHLSYASSLWISGVLIWSGQFLWKIFFRHKSTLPS